MIFSYLTIEGSSEGSYKEKGSKFLGFAYPVQSEDDVKSKIQELKKKYFDARHHCFAYVLGADKKRFRAFDDGEPNHSAGDPILGQIRSNDLTNVLIVVVRYFGGTKLGVGGLISAYKRAAEECIGNAIIVEREVTEEIKLSYEFSASAEVMRLVKEFDIIIRSQDFGDGGSLTGELKLKNLASFHQKMKLFQALGNPIHLKK